jgi:type I restriction enzyme M protein
MTIKEVEARLWNTADQLWANTGLRPSQFSTPVLGLIFLRYAEKRFVDRQAELEKEGVSPAKADKYDYQEKGVLYLPENARFSRLLALPEGENLGRAVNEAMAAVEAENEELKGILPRTYTALPNETLVEILRLLAPLDLKGDAFGQIYEYFLGEFALAEGQKGGVFYTPTSIVRLIVEIIEPYHGRIFDPACGSGGMFVQSANFVKRHRKVVASEITVFGTEKDKETVKLAKMNLAVHGLSGDIRESNTYYEDPHKSLGRFDFVMANPPFNVSGVDKERLKTDKRSPFGLPSTDNANYLWIQNFYSALNDTGRAGFVMANSASDARGAEQEIRRKLVEDRAVDAVVAVGSNMFYTVTLPCTLWFLSKGKRKSGRADKVLFLDARHLYRQMTRAHRKWSPKQIEYLANIVRLYRGEQLEFVAGPDEDYPGPDPDLKETFPDLAYRDVPGLCKVATIKEIEAQGWSLNPGRYVGVAPGESVSDEDFKEQFEALNEELETLNAQARELEETIARNAAEILEV